MQHSATTNRRAGSGDGSESTEVVFRHPWQQLSSLLWVLQRAPIAPRSAACQSASEGENDRPQWGPSAAV
ncbi:unnamed protein product [Lota lota]